MLDINDELIKLRDQTWQVARESLEIKELNIYRALTDIAERLTDLVGTTGKRAVIAEPEGNLIPIFAQYKGEKYEARLDVARINGGSRPCLWMEGKWWSVSGAAIYLKEVSINPPKNPETNGWRYFWKYDKDGVMTAIEELKKRRKE